jgi:hypothetical protein
MHIKRNFQGHLRVFCEVCMWAMHKNQEGINISEDEIVEHIISDEHQHSKT